MISHVSYFLYLFKPMCLASPEFVNVFAFSTFCCTLIYKSIFSFYSFISEGVLIAIPGSTWYSLHFIFIYFFKDGNISVFKVQEMWKYKKSLRKYFTK